MYYDEEELMDLEDQLEYLLDREDDRTEEDFAEELEYKAIVRENRRFDGTSLKRCIGSEHACWGNELKMEKYL